MNRELPWVIDISPAYCWEFLYPRVLNQLCFNSLSPFHSLLYIKYINLAGACLETGMLTLLVLVSAQHSMYFLFLLC